MKRALSILLAGSCLVAPALAQPEDTVVPYIPDSESPFFVVRDEFNPATAAGQQRASQQYPRNKGAEVSAGKMFTSFFTDMFANVRIGGDEGRRSSQIAIDPEKFSLDDRREILVNYSVTNRTREITKLDFPNAQRIEITVTDPAGKVIERWSDDRFFGEVTGVVMINPEERIEYSERIPTREMQPGVTYVIEASVPNYPEFTRTAKVTPTGQMRTEIMPVVEVAPTPESTSPDANGDAPSNFL